MINNKRLHARTLRSGAKLSLGGLLATTCFTAHAFAAEPAPSAAPAAEPAAAGADGAVVTAPDESIKVNGITVTGRVAAIDKSIRAKRNSDVVSDGVYSDEISSIPEFGLGDALLRVPGVAFQINNGRGEDQFMTLRGLNSDYNTTTVDGVALVGTEETTRQTSFDVLPAVLAKGVDVYKTWTVDLPSDAVGGVTDIHTRSAFDHPGLFISGHIDGAYWENEREVHPNEPSGQGDFTISKTFGPEDHFGFLLLGSYYTRSSDTLNTYTLPWTYYQSNGVGNAMTPKPLSPTSGVDGLIGVPNTHRWYFYDNIRTRPGVFTKLEYNDNAVFHAHLSAGIFEHLNDENRYSNYLTMGTGAVVTQTSPTTGSVSTGKADIDYDRYFQYRQTSYVDLGGGVNLTPHTHLDLTINVGYGHYRQDTIEDQYLTASSAAYGYTYNLNAPTSPLFFPTNPAAVANLANYAQQYHLTAVDSSHTTLPQYKLDFKHNVDPGDLGWGFKAGVLHRELNQTYYYDQIKATPTGTAPTLAQIGVINEKISPDNGEGQSLILLDPHAVTAYIKAHPGSYTVLSTGNVNDYHLTETIDAGYGEARYRGENFLVIAGLRYEETDQSIDNLLGSTTSNVATHYESKYSKLLPSVNASYDFSPKLKLRAAVTETLARPQYAQLAENGAATLSGTPPTASLANPNLKPRESWNYDLSLEYYPWAGAVASVAIFDKEISNEIVTTTVANQTVGGVSGVLLTQAQNVGHASVNGVELNFVDTEFKFLPGPLKHLGLSTNASFNSFGPPQIRMSDGNFYRLPQLLNSSKNVINAALLYNYGRYSAEVAFNHTSKMPISFDTTNRVNDQWWAASNTLDAQLRVKLNEHLSIRVQGKNLTNDQPQKVVGPDQALNYSTLDNGRAYWAGVGFIF